jgi:glycosyltransferase involved in cell wall biosynthesis
MNRPLTSKGAILMIAYTNYRTDPRVIRAAEAAVGGGFEVDFIALRREGEPLEEMVRGVRVLRVNQYRYRGRGLFRYMLAYLGFFIRCFFKSAILSFRRPYTVVHVNNMPDFLVFCTLIPKLMGAKILLDIHDPMPNTFASKFKSGDKGFFFKLLLGQEKLSAWYSDRVLTVHDPVKDLILVKHGLPAESIQVIANFADDELFTLNPDYQADGRLRLIFHGTILERYGLRTLVQALSMVRNKDKMSVKIIGEGDFSGEFKKLIAAAGLENFVHFDNQFYPMHDIPRIISDANIGLVPLEISSITNYALPLKMLEYTSMGLPVITVRNAAISYYFGETDCLYYEPGDAESLRAVLDRVAADPALLMHYHQKAVAIREKFFWSNEKRKYISLLQDLSNCPAPNAGALHPVAK